MVCDQSVAHRSDRAGRNEGAGSRNFLDLSLGAPAADPLSFALWSPMFWLQKDKRLNDVLRLLL